MARWSNTEMQQLRTLWTADVSARDIASRLGRSRMAVIGKANRMGLKFRGVWRDPFSRRLAA